MAIYGRDFYGLSIYGSPLYTSLDVSPFIANPDRYERVNLSWNSPNGSWEQFRLLRSKFGYAVRENDGDILLDTDLSVKDYIDNDVVGGTYYYYTIYLKDSDGWHRVAVAQVLVTSDRGYDKILWEKIPRFYQYIPRAANGVVLQTFNSADVYTTDRTDQGNFYLQQFLSLFAYGLSGIHDYVDTVLSVNNPLKINLENLHNLTTQVGSSYEYEVPGRVTRKRVAEAAYLARNRGTISGLRELVIATVGWDVDLTLSNNYFLTKDQSQFYHPIFPEWDSGRVYPEGERVNFSGFLFQCKPGGAFGDAQMPPKDSNENTWWVWADYAVQSELVDSDGSLNQWSVYQGNGDRIPAQMAISVTSPVETSESTASNCLFVSNDSESAQTYSVISVTPSDDEDFDRVVQGLPVPNGLPWDRIRTYLKGDLVNDRGTLWQSLRENRGKRPADFHNDWVNLKADDRPQMSLSGWGHAGNGVGPTIPAQIDFDQADSRGRLVNQRFGSPKVLWVTSEGTDLGIYDTFNDSVGSVGYNRTPDVFKASTWYVENGQWQIIEDEEGQGAAPAPDGSLMMNAPAGWTKWRIAVTLKTTPLGTRKQGIIFRKTSASTYAFVARDGVYYRSGGALTLLSAFDTEYLDGDRVMVELNNSSPTDVDIFRNETHVGSFTLPFSNTSDYFGMGVE